MTRKTAKVTVGLPVYNGEKYLAEAIESMLCQTYEDFVLLVLDEASGDATEDIGRTYERQHDRVRYYRNERNLGLAPNFNKAFRLSSSPYFKWAAYDDLCGPEFLERCVDVLDSDPSVVLAHTEMQPIDERGAFLPFDQEHQAFVDRGGNFRYPDLNRRVDLRSLDVVTLFKAILHKGPGHELYGLIRTSALQKTSLLRSHGRLLLNELGFMGRIHHVPEPLFFPRFHSENVHRETRRERLHMQTGRTPKIVLPPWREFIDYLSVITAADITSLQKLRCAWALMQYAARPTSIKYALLPGPNNYWGISRRRG